MKNACANGCSGRAVEAQQGDLAGTCPAIKRGGWMKALPMVLAGILAAGIPAVACASQQVPHGQASGSPFDLLTLSLSGGRPIFSDRIQIRANGFATEIQTGRGAPGYTVAAGKLSHEQLAKIASALDAALAPDTRNAKRTCPPPVPDAPRSAIRVIKNGRELALPGLPECSPASQTELAVAISEAMQSLGPVPAPPFGFLATRSDATHYIEIDGGRRTATEIVTMPGVDGTRIRAGYLSDPDMRKIRAALDALLAADRQGMSPCRHVSPDPFLRRREIIADKRYLHGPRAWPRSTCRSQPQWQSLEEAIESVARGLKPAQPVGRDPR
jgi:hypothetical protein